MPTSRKRPAVSQDTAPTPSVARPALPRAEPAVQQTLALPPIDNATRHTPPVALDVRRKLWLCIWLPWLSLETLYRRDDTACAVYEERDGIRRVSQASPKARSAGVAAGLSINAALSLAPQLSLEERSPDQEDRLIRRLAGWAERFTSFVAIGPEGVLLLEVAGSERLFDGVEAIRLQIAHGLDAQGLTAMLAVAPTPLASIWLARSGRECCIDDVARLAGALAPLSLDSLGWPVTVTRKLRGVGVASVGDCLRLPRQGFTRRFGAAYLDELDRAVGRSPDPRVSYRTPERFSADYELPEEQSDSELLLTVCRALLEKLETFLRTRQMCIQRVQFRFYHLKEKATRLTLGRVQAGQGVDHWFELLRIRFDRIALPAPVIAVRLRGGQGQRSSLQTGSLLSGSDARDTSITSLVERLSARIGEAAVHGVDTVAEHRPQHAWRPAELQDDAPRCAAIAGFWNEREMPRLLGELQRTSSLLLRRPLWILDSPERLAVREGRPRYYGALTLVDGPERLESGWWDDEGIARDYFVAKTDDGVRLWIYRDRRTDTDWYLHGMFG